MSIAAVPHPDRVHCARWLLVSLTASVAVAVAIAGSVLAEDRFSPALGFVGGLVLASLAMVGLTSVSMRLVARVLLLVSASVVVRFSLVSGSIATGGQALIGWLVAAVFVLVFSDRVGTDAVAPLGEAPAEERSPRPWSTVRVAAAIAAIVVLAAVIAAPLLLPYVGRTVEPGEGATLDPAVRNGSVLRSTDSLDMTSRPDLTDEVVFTVDTNRATFWRGQTFDVWDGRRWTRSESRFSPLATADTPRLSPDDLSAQGSDVVEQRFRIEASYADIVHAAATAVEVQIDRPLRQRADGTLESAPLGRGAAYTVTSRRIPLSVDKLRSVRGAIPESVQTQYAQPPQTTDRVRAAALEVTAGAETTYDKIIALENWMGDRVAYSLDAPLAPKNVDVVDHFLFDAEAGWCEQIASSLVVLARANGIGARLVTGYVPADQDPVTGQFTVRQRDAHAWAEVWFPEVGWVPFDPTADISLAGSDASQPTVAQWIADHLVVVGLSLAAVLLLVGPVRLGLRRARARRAARPVGWAAQAAASLDALGVHAQRARQEHETATAYGQDLAVRYQDPRLGDVGRLIDDATYAAQPPSPQRQAEADAVLVAVSRVSESADRR